MAQITQIGNASADGADYADKAVGRMTKMKTAVSPTAGRRPGVTMSGQSLRVKKFKIVVAFSRLNAPGRILQHGDLQEL